MNKQEAAELLTERAMTEPDVELAEAMIKGAHALQRDTYEWVEGDLRDWLKKAE